MKRPMKRFSVELTYSIEVEAEDESNAEYAAYDAIDTWSPDYSRTIQLDEDEEAEELAGED